jgi:cyanophycinase
MARAIYPFMGFAMTGKRRSDRIAAGLILAAGVTLAVGARSASGQSDEVFDAPWPRQLRLGGSVVVSGGGEIDAAAIGRFRELAGGARARVVALPLSESAASGAEVERFRGALERLGVESFSILQADTRAAAESLDFARSLSRATGVWLCGDSLERLALYRESRVWDRLRDALERGGALGANAVVAVALGEAAEAEGDAESPGASPLVPGTILRPRFNSRLDARGALDALADRPGLLEIGIDAGAAMVLSGRRIEAVGAGSLTMMVPSSSLLDARAVRLGPGEAAIDWTAWRRQAVERTITAFPAIDPAPPKVAAGALIVWGDDRIIAPVWEAFMKAVGGPDAPIVYIPAEERETLDGAPRMVERIRQAGARNVVWLHTKNRATANDDEAFLAPLREAKGIWFGGGRQWNFVDSYLGTTAHRLMLDVLERGGAIAGGSAGASIQAEYMARGDPLGNRNIQAPGYERGLGFITGVAIDQHFSERRRLPDMTGLMEAHPQLLGIGLDERTAIVVRGSIAEVIGEGRAHFYDRGKPTRESEPDFEALGAGGRYDLAARRILDGGDRPK